MDEWWVLRKYNTIKTYIEIISESNCKLITTKEEFCNSVEQNTDPYKVKLKILCGQCNKNIFEISFSRFKNSDYPKQVCNECGDNILSLEDAKTYANKVGSELFSDIWNGHSSKYLFKCANPNCNNIYERRFNAFKCKNRIYCGDCTSRKTWNINKAKEYALSVGSELLSEKWNGFREEYLFKCSSCGDIFKTNFNKFHNFKKNRCDICAKSISSGALKTKQWLINNNIIFDSEYTFDNLKGLGGSSLRYDFAILNDNNNLLCLIEFDGGQHFRPITFGGISYEEAELKFTIRVYHDALKNAYCEDNNIPLIRIPFWDENNIDFILQEKLTPLI